MILFRSCFLFLIATALNQRLAMRRIPRRAKFSFFVLHDGTPPFARIESKAKDFLRTPEAGELCDALFAFQVFPHDTAAAALLAAFPPFGTMSFHDSMIVVKCIIQP